MTNLCYYDVLEIEKGADKQAIKQAYRKMAKKYHPDKNPDDKEAEENFKVVNEAYQVLSDEQKRGIYDRYGKDGLEGHQQGGGFSRGGGFDDLGSMFEEMFSGRRRQERKTYNYELDSEVKIHLEFNEAIFGINKEIKYKYKIACKSCKGTGAKGGKLSNCKTCNGQGQVHMKQGFMTFAQTCPHCEGSGKSATSKCSDCNASGYETIEKSFKVDIPEGVNNGNRIRVSNKGNVAPNGTKGDLYILISVKEDKNFIRHDDNIYLEVPLFFTQIALGETIKFPSLKGELELTIPKGTNDKQQFTFRGEGVKTVNGYGKGDFIVQIKIQYPESLNNEQKELLEKLQNSFGIESKPHEDMFNSMFENVKNWFKK